MTLRKALRRIAPAAALAAALAGCAGSQPAQLVTPPGFEPGATADCLLHQTDHPDAAFAGGAAAEPAAQLRFLAYYTAAGRTPFCDRTPATDADRAWARLYVDLTGNPTNVSSVLG